MDMRFGYMRDLKVILPGDREVDINIPLGVDNTCWKNIAGIILNESNVDNANFGSFFCY
jgi:hypothetical protein